MKLPQICLLLLSSVTLVPLSLFAMLHRSLILPVRKTPYEDIYVYDNKGTICDDGSETTIIPIFRNVYATMLKYSNAKINTMKKEVEQSSDFSDKFYPYLYTPFFSLMAGRAVCKQQHIDTLSAMQRELHDNFHKNSFSYIERTLLGLALDGTETGRPALPKDIVRRIIEYSKLRDPALCSISEKDFVRLATSSTCLFFTVPNPNKTLTLLYASGKECELNSDGFKALSSYKKGILLSNGRHELWEI